MVLTNSPALSCLFPSFADVWLTNNNCTHLGCMTCILKSTMWWFNTLCVVITIVRLITHSSSHTATFGCVFVCVVRTFKMLWVLIHKALFHLTFLSACKALSLPVLTSFFTHWTLICTSNFRWTFSFPTSKLSLNPLSCTSLPARIFPFVIFIKIYNHVFS